MILMGSDKRSATYIGTLNTNWEPVDSIGKEHFSLLRQLKRF